MQPTGVFGRDPLVALIMFVISVCIVILAYVFSGRKLLEDESSVRSSRVRGRAHLLPRAPGSPPKTH